MRRTLIAIASAATLVSACSGGEHGFYRAEAESTCRERGLAAGTPAFERCVIEEERSVYIWVDRGGY